MEDRFKFRCFWEDDKQMYYFDNYCMPHITKEDEKIAHIMQCTGLKDKNGKLIFECDIVEIATEEENAIIKWEEDTANFSIHILNENVIANFDNFWSYQLEVLGNIYEDKYLLGEEN